MDRDGTALWLSKVIPAELEFKDVDGHRLALAALPNSENLAATTHFAQVDTGLEAQHPETGKPVTVRAELITVARAGQADLAKLLIEAAELLQVAQVVPAQPGTLLPKLGPNLHAMLVAPWLWGGDTPQLQEADRWTLLLQVVALNDEEYAYAVEEGVAALQQAVAESGIDLLDWSRVGPWKVD